MKTMNHPTSFAKRREFLARSLGLGASSLIAPLGFNLAAAGNAVAQTTEDYRAVVFVYLGGGNDSFNSVVPYDTASYNKYQQARAGLARDRALLLPITPTTSQGGKEVRLNANLIGIKTLFDTKRLAIVSNVGPLIVPVTRANFGRATTPLPPQLFSHSDQSNYWMTSQGNGGQQGWGGLFGDALASRNTARAFSTVSVFGYSKLLVGEQTTFFTLSEAGAPGVYFDAGSPLDAVLTRSSTRTNLLERAYAQVHENLRDNAGALSSAILPESTFGPVPGGGRNTLAQQLLTVARTIGARAALGMKRQVFYVQLGGFDTHSGQNEAHEPLMIQLNDALTYFDECMGTLNARDLVTLATFSEFGRTLTSNGDGTDHGWGSHHFVMGGRVKGGDIYGTLPTIDLAGNDFLGEGNMIPTTSVEQFGATFANWMGVPGAQISTIFPNLGNFSSSNLGFFTS
jgi:uncharacterized protein (DUF1501 family)